MAAMRTKPVTRESIVPTATSALDRTSEVSDSVGLEPGSTMPTSSTSRRRDVVPLHVAPGRRTRVAGAWSRGLPGGRRQPVRGVLLCARFLRRRWMSQPHQIARNTIAPTVRKTPTPLTKVERTLIVVRRRSARPSGVVTVSSTGDVPEPRVSTATRTVVLCCGGERDVALGTLGEQEAVALELEVDGDVLVAPLFWKLIGISALLDVIVTVLPAAAPRSGRGSPSTEVPIDASRSRAAWRPGRVSTIGRPPTTPARGRRSATRGSLGGPRAAATASRLVHAAGVLRGGDRRCGR